MTEKYDFQAIEKKWHERWDKANLYVTRMDPSKPKYYYLDMFPYPSGGMHMGHVRNYIIGDVFSRYRVMNGHNVLHPMGFDSFGIPAEMAAIESGIHPAKWTMDCIARWKEQFHQLGISFDWSREVITCLPEYYKWNQWFFLKFLEKGLAYKKMAPANWCPVCETVLANEEAEGGICWRCDSPVTRKDIEQWFFRITEYAERLLQDIDLLEDWPERVRVMQQNWIGRSEGVVINFKVAETGDDMPVYTTRQDTIYGVTYMVLAPEHPLVEKLTAGTKYESAVREFVAQVRTLSEIERLSTTLEKVGMFIGAYAINPMSGEKVPIWITNYVLLEYGTGMVMGVPAHDQRDFEFARKYNLPIREVIVPPGQEPQDPDKMVAAYVEPGVQVNSGPFDGMPSEQAREAIADYMEEHKIGHRQVTYRLRDWLISRQRYWGTPIPVVYCEKCGMVPVPEDQLPIVLPTDVQFTGKGESPLAKSSEFVNTTCPKCAGHAKRETDTMATWIDSSWYFLRYASPHEDKLPFDPKAVDFWLPVDQYVGGVEHAVLHLLYSRFFTKVIHDLGLIKFAEPFSRLFTQGMIYKDGYKMSKSRGNVVSPDYICAKYGADTGRVFILFVGPPDQDAEWSDQGVEGVFRYLNRVWRFFASNINGYVPTWRDVLKDAGLTAPERNLRRKTHQTIQKVTSDIERFHFNTAVSALMEMLNEMVDFASRQSPVASRQQELPCLQASEGRGENEPAVCSLRSAVLSEAMENLVLLIAPFAPHMADELWERLGKPGTTYEQTWPKHDPAIAKAEEVTIVLQVNGKVRDRIQVPADTDRSELERLALESDRVLSFLDNKPVKKVIVVPGKLVNIVV